MTTNLTNPLSALLECPSEFEFPSVAAGVTCKMQCQLKRGHNGPHKAMFHGLPYEWADQDETSCSPSE